MKGIQADSHTSTKEPAISFLLAGVLVSILQRNKAKTRLCRDLSQGIRSDHVTLEAEQMSARGRPETLNSSSLSVKSRSAGIWGQSKINSSVQVENRHVLPRLPSIQACTGWLMPHSKGNKLSLKSDF